MAVGGGLTTKHLWVGTTTLFDGRRNTVTQMIWLRVVMTMVIIMMMMMVMVMMVIMIAMIMMIMIMMNMVIVMTELETTEKLAHKETLLFVTNVT